MMYFENENKKLKTQLPEKVSESESTVWYKTASSHADIQIHFMIGQLELDTV